MANLIPYIQDVFGSIRSVMIDDEPWFVAADVCKVLDIKNSRDAVSRLDDDEKKTTVTDTLGGPQKVSVINESGLYSLVFRSRKPEARKFKRWLTHEVLPSIRKHGIYIANEDLFIKKYCSDIPEEEAQQLKELMLEIKAEMDKDQERIPHFASKSLETSVLHDVF